MLKLQAVAQFCQPMNAVAEEFTQRLQGLRDTQGEVQGLEHEIFKWAMECEWLYRYIVLLVVRGGRSRQGTRRVQGFCCCVNFGLKCEGQEAVKGFLECTGEEEVLSLIHISEPTRPT